MKFRLFISVFNATVVLLPHVLQLARHSDPHPRPFDVSEYNKSRGLSYWFEHFSTFLSSILTKKNMASSIPPRRHSRVCPHAVGANKWFQTTSTSSRPPPPSHVAERAFPRCQRPLVEIDSVREDERGVLPSLSNPRRR